MMNKPIRSKLLCVWVRKIGIVIIFEWLNAKVQQV